VEAVKILTRPSYFRSLKKFSVTEISEINASIAMLREAMGKPHVHSGLSVRKLRRAIFEIRAGLETRILFARESGDIVLVFAGNHNQVRAWLKENV
jgi:hypothetical protein